MFLMKVEGYGPRVMDPGGAYTYPPVMTSGGSNRSGQYAFLFFLHVISKSVWLIYSQGPNSSGFG